MDDLPTTIVAHEVASKNEVPKDCSPADHLQASTEEADVLKIDKFEYVVVEFGRSVKSRPSATTEAEVISSRWLLGKYVHWPKCSSSRFVSLVKGHIEPRTVVKTWEEHPILRVVGRSMSYDHAQKILLDSDCTESEFPEKESENAPISGRLRKRVRNIIAADSSDDEDVSLRGNITENQVSRIRERPNVDDEEEEAGEEEIYIPPTKEININKLGSSAIMTSINNQRKRSGGGETRDLEDADVVVDEPDELQSTYSLEDDRDVEEAIGPVGEDNTCDNNKILKHSSSCLLCEDCAKNLASIAEAIKSLKNYAHPASTNSTKFNSLDTESMVFNKLPCMTMTDLDTFEQFLENVDNMNFMVAKFRCYSNTALTIFVNSCLRKIMSDELACNFNAKGSIDGGALIKESYLNKNFLVLLIETVVNSLPQIQTVPKGTVERVKCCAGAWFRNAKKRLDSRKSNSSRGQSRPSSSASTVSGKTSHTATTPPMQTLSQSGRQTIWRNDNTSEYQEAHYKSHQNRWSAPQFNETSPSRYSQTSNMRTPERPWRPENNAYYRYSPYSPYRSPASRGRPYVEHNHPSSYQTGRNGSYHSSPGPSQHIGPTRGMIRKPARPQF